MPVFQYQGSFELENGGRLLSPSVFYQQWGTPNADGSNVIWVCHALTANADVLSWWKGLFGPGSLFDPKDWCIVCANVLGSCYGTMGPLSMDPETGTPYYHSFPRITIRDMVQAHRALCDYLGIERIELLIGGSLGGQQALEWSILEPHRFFRLVVIATNAEHSPWGVAFNATQRMAIEADPTWLRKGDSEAGLAGMKVARATALLSYRSYQTFQNTQAPSRKSFSETHPAISYQQYQGEKLAQRFNAYSYWHLSHAMDSHDVGRERGSLFEALQRIEAETLVLSIDSDLLFPVSEQVQISRAIPRAFHATIPSIYGHDGFLIETQAISERIADFLFNGFNTYKTISFISPNNKNTWNATLEL